MSPLGKTAVIVLLVPLAGVLGAVGAGFATARVTGNQGAGFAGGVLVGLAVTLGLTYATLR